MHNRPTNVLREAEPESSGFDRASLHRNPVLRLSLLFVLMLLPLAVVAGRLLTLQQTQADEFIAGFEPKLTESMQPIETTDGRILMDGLVMAEDVASYRLKMHYRWIEEPCDERWLRHKANERLSRSDRRDKDRVTAAQEQVLADRCAGDREQVEPDVSVPQQFARRAVGPQFHASPSVLRARCWWRGAGCGVTLAVSISR